MKLSLKKIFNLPRDYVKYLLELNKVKFNAKETKTINIIYRDNRYKATILFFKAKILNISIDKETILSRSFKERYVNASISQRFDLLGFKEKVSEYKKKTIDEFGDRLANPNNEADFDTWKEFYDYVNRMINDRVDIFTLNDLDVYKLKRGDLIEDTDESDYRMDGVRIFDGRKIKDLEDIPDDYGTIPKNYKVISDFPVSYWHDSYNKLNKFESYWHNSYVWFDPTEIGLKIYKKDFKKITYKYKFDPEKNEEDEKEQISYFYIFSHKNIKYCIIIEDSEIFDEKLNLNKSIAYSVIDGDMTGLHKELETFLQNKGIYKEQILIK